MKALITGIRGAAGSYLAAHLRAKGIAVVGISRPECDVGDFDAVRARLEAERPAVIYHLASKADVRASFDDPLGAFDNNARGTVVFLEAVRASGQHPVINLCSSSELYGEPAIVPIPETAPIRQTNPYSFSKACQDLAGQMYARCYGFHVVVSRAFGYINPRRRDLSLSNFARQIAAIERGEAEELLHGNLESVRTFCDVRDIVDAYARVTELPPVSIHPWSGIYNIGSMEPISIGRCLEMLVEQARCPIRTRLDPALTRRLDVTNQIPDCGRFQKMTGWAPRIPLRESLTWLLEHYRNGAH